LVIRRQAPSSSGYVQHFPTVVVNGNVLGGITLREFSEHQRSIHLGALLSLLRSELPAAEFERLSTVASANFFVSFEELRRAGITIQYDPLRERLLIGVE
jgi:hypothetical protein